MNKWHFTSRFISAIALLVIILLVAGGVALANGGAPRVTTLSGAEEVNGGDPDGSGYASIWLNHGQGTVCWEVSYANLAELTGAHIHAAPAGVNGPVVVPLSPIASGCTEVNKDLIKAIIQNPELYYVNVHSVEFRPGAIRGQLSNRGQSK